MYYHQAIKAQDKNHFIIAIVKEINAQINNKHWNIVPLTEVPKEPKLLMQFGA